MLSWPAGFILIAAALLPVQAACNAALNRALKMPAAVVLVSVACSAMTMIVAGLLSGQLSPIPASRLAQAPVWAWAGGVFGAVFLLTQPVAAPRLGAGLYLALSVTAQVAAAVLLDHFGALGMPHHPASLVRVAGVVLMACGVVLVARG